MANAAGSISHKTGNRNIERRSSEVEAGLNRIIRLYCCISSMSFSNEDFFGGVVDQSRFLAAHPNARITIPPTTRPPTSVFMAAFSLLLSTFCHLTS